MERPRDSSTFFEEIGLKKISEEDAAVAPAIIWAFRFGLQASLPVPLPPPTGSSGIITLARKPLQILPSKGLKCQNLDSQGLRGDFSPGALGANCEMHYLCWDNHGALRGLTQGWTSQAVCGFLPPATCNRPCCPARQRSATCHHVSTMYRSRSGTASRRDAICLCRWRVRCRK